MVWDKISQWVVDTAVHSAADGLMIVGDVLCVASGAGMSLADMWKTRVDYDYYGQVNLQDNVTLALRVESLHYTMEETIPIEYQDQRVGRGSYDVSQWLRPETMQLYSLITFGVGTLSRVGGSYLKQWQQFREEKRWIRDEDKELSVKPPSVREINYATAASLSGSFGYFFLGNTVINAFTEYTFFNGKDVTFTYPLSGERLANASLYDGPLHHTCFPIAYHDAWDRNISLPWGSEVLAKESIDAPGHVTAFFGGTAQLAFSPKAKGITLLAAAGGSAAYVVYRFFANKKQAKRDERVNEDMIGRKECMDSKDTLLLVEVGLQ